MEVKMHTLLTLVMLCFAVHCVSSDETETTTSAIPTDFAATVNDILANNPQSLSVSTVTNCECGVFNTMILENGVRPLITQNPIGVNCDSAGEQTCKNLCYALATAAKERGPDILCSHLGHYSHLTASVHSRICDAQQWTYTGLTSPNEICCHENKVIDCKDQVEPSAPPLSDIPPNQL